MKKIFVIILAVLLTGAMSAKAMEYFRGTPAEIAQVQNDVLGYEAIDGNKVNTGGYFRENLLPLTNNLYDVGSSVLQFKDGYFAGNVSITGTLTSGALSSAGNLLPSVSATYDIGSSALQWDELWVQTLHATIQADVSEPLLVGNGSVSSTINGSSTSTFPYGATFATTGGNVGIGTATPAGLLDVNGKLTVLGTGNVGIGNTSPAELLSLKHATRVLQEFILGSTTIGYIGNAAALFTGSGTNDFGIMANGATALHLGTNATRRLIINSSGLVGIGNYNTPQNLLTLYAAATTTPLLAISNGAATTTIAGGEVGSVTSTFAGDVSIPNLYSGMLTLPTDSGWSSLIDIGVSGSAVTSTKQGYSFDIDGLPTIGVFGSSDALGSVYNRRVEMTNGSGTATTTLQSPSNTATTTIYMGVKESTAKGIGTCLVMTGDDGVRYYISVVGGVLTPSTVSCENAGLGLSRD